jgi:hypothetical protein
MWLVSSLGELNEAGDAAVSDIQNPWISFHSMKATHYLLAL